MSLVSIITPAFNCEETIGDTYRSISEQDYTNWEWLVTDDCSTDNTYKILKEISKNDCRVKIIKNKWNSGAAISRNNAIKMAAGDFIAFIDADDLWHAEKLKEQLLFMGGDIDFSFTSYELIAQDGSPLNKQVDVNNSCVFSYFDMLKKSATLGCSTVILRRNAFNVISMPEIGTTEDYALWLELLSSGKSAHKLNKVLMKYRVSPNSVSSNKLKTAKNQWLVYRKFRRLSFIDSFCVFLFYVKNAIFRK